MTINAYDPTLVLPINTTQSEINQVATNAIKFGVDSTLAVIRFINNRTILGIAQGVILPLAPNVPPAAVAPNGTLPLLPLNPPTTMTPEKKRALAIFKETDNATLLKSQAILDAQRAANEINNALFGLVAPPIVVII